MSLILQAHLLDKYGPRLTMDQLAEVLGMPVNTLLNRIYRGEAPVVTYRQGGKRWASYDAVAAFLEDCAEQAKKNPDAEVRVKSGGGDAARQQL